MASCEERTSKLEGHVASLEAKLAQVLTVVGELKATIERMDGGNAAGVDEAMEPDDAATVGATEGKEEPRGEKEKESMEKIDMKDAKYGYTDIR